MDENIYISRPVDGFFDLHEYKPLNNQDNLSYDDSISHNNLKNFVDEVYNVFSEIAREEMINKENKSKSSSTDRVFTEEFGEISKDKCAKIRENLIDEGVPVVMAYRRTLDSKKNDEISRGYRTCIEKSFSIRDVKYSGFKVIVFWEDDTKTIVTMNEEEENYDPEKALFAAYTKKVISMMNLPSRGKSVDLHIKHWLDKYNKNKDEYTKDRSRIMDRKFRKIAEARKDRETDAYSNMSDKIDDIIEEMNNIDTDNSKKDGNENDRFE